MPIFLKINMLANFISLNNRLSIIKIKLKIIVLTFQTIPLTIKLLKSKLLKKSK